MVKQRKRQQESLSNLSELIQEDLSGISAIKIYGQENAEQKAFSKRNDKYRDSAINLARTARLEQNPGRQQPQRRLPRSKLPRELEEPLVSNDEE